ncbi:unnamed protein product [Thlaspi arvense]|uniref:Uncharacterized protein n=1 Tax=Thlaspi arvense TaxID=13288 RepID=A0AAU9RT64_THLAR|nr:unnamed protein product [Thlaspi arvense]
MAMGHGCTIGANLLPLLTALMIILFHLSLLPHWFDPDDPLKTTDQTRRLGLIETCSSGDYMFKLLQSPLLPWGIFGAMALAMAMALWRRSDAMAVSKFCLGFADEPWASASPRALNEMG